MLRVTLWKCEVVDGNMSSYSIAMACQPQAGHGGRGGVGRGGRGGRFPRQNKPGSLPCKSGEVSAWEDLEQNVFTIGSGNKGKDGDLLRTSREKKLALNIVEPNMGIMHVRSGNLRSNWCCKSLLTLTQYLQGMHYGRKR
jgi:hypothetical protein